MDLEKVNKMLDKFAQTEKVWAEIGARHNIRTNYTGTELIDPERLKEIEIVDRVFKEWMRLHNS